MTDKINGVPVGTVPEHMTQFELYIADLVTFEKVEAWLHGHGIKKLAVRDYHGWPRDCFFRVDKRAAVFVFDQLLAWNDEPNHPVHGCRFSVYF
jgi:hypothetical protein